MPATPDPRLTDAFQALILREVLLADGLQNDLRMAELADWLGRTFAKPAAAAVTLLTETNASSLLGRLPETLTRKAITSLFNGPNSLWLLRHVRGLASWLADAETAAHSYCRTALCYAVQGDSAEALRWLKSAEDAIPDLARPKFLRGLIHGAEGDREGAVRELTAATKGRARKVTHGRIREALQLIQGDGADE